MTNAPDESRELRVWATVIDPESEDGRLALTACDKAEPVEWAVPAAATMGDFVLAWVTGGTGFRYLLKIQGVPRKPSAEEFGPQQATLALVAPIHPSLPMPRLKADAALRSWWLVRYSMQGVVRAQQNTLTRDREWSAFLRLLESVAPKAATQLRGPTASSSTATTDTGTPARGSYTVSLLDVGSTTPTIMVVTRELAAALARATLINDKRDGRDLTFSSLLLAVVFGDDRVGPWLQGYFREQGVKLQHTFSRIGKDVDSARTAAKRAKDERDAVLTSPLRRSPSGRQALDEAAKIAAAQPVAAVDTHHLVAAFIALTNYHEEDFGALTLDRQRWGAAFVQHMARHTEDAAEIGFWRRFYERRFPNNPLPPLDTTPRIGHRSDYDADAYTSRDLLSIEDEVVALSYVITAKDTQPPLAIGLFGDWGSGKTFFMKHLRRRIDRLCQEAQAHKPAERECHARIAQIEFNAWHYQEGDLWASLVDHILRNLRFGEDEEDTKVAERRDKLVRELDAAEQRATLATARATDARQRADAAERRVAELKTEAAERRQELAAQLTPTQIFTAARAGLPMASDLRRQAEALSRELGLPQAESDAVALKNALSDAHRELAGAWAFLLPLLRAKDRGRRFILLGTALVVPIVLAFVIHAMLGQQELLGRLASVVVGAGSLLGAVATWVSKQTQWVRDLRSRVEPVAKAVNAAVDEAIEDQLTQQRKAIADTMTQLETLRQEQSRAQQEKDEAAVQAVSLRSNLAVLGNDTLMRAFLDDRLGGGVYQQKLGIAALVRRDFERLSRNIERDTKREAEGTLTDDLLINRIVLYIDDLDRCEMDKVVPVLRAVHLLLAFPAFVVVVGVDSRWVARCLARHHKDIFAPEDGGAQPQVAPLDYLEKIFQIPIWLEPVPPERRIHMVRQLLRKPAAPSRVVSSPPPESPHDGKESEPELPVTQTANDEVATQTVETVGKTPSAPALAAAVTGPDETPIDVSPQGLTITDGEYEFLTHLGALLSSSPRTIKRFVNTYRLINVALTQAGIRDSDHQPSNSEIRMLLLAVLVGMPDLSRWLQQALRERNGTNLAITPFLDVMEAGKATANAGDSGPWSVDQAMAQWDIVRQWITERGEPWTTVRAARVAEWLEFVGRYTFNLTRSAAGRPTPPAEVRT